MHCNKHYAVFLLHSWLKVLIKMTILRCVWGIYQLMRQTYTTHFTIVYKFTLLFDFFIYFRKKWATWLFRQTLSSTVEWVDIASPQPILHLADLLCAYIGRHGMMVTASNLNNIHCDLDCICTPRPALKGLMCHLH